MKKQDDFDQAIAVANRAQNKPHAQAPPTPARTRPLKDDPFSQFLLGVIAGALFVIIVFRIPV